VIVLDTHAWLWWCADRSKLKPALVRRLAKESALYVSAISAWEVCMLVEKGRLTLSAQPRAAVRALCGADGIRMVAISDAIATEAALLGSSFHGDPADRFVVATALDLRAKLVTKDERITAADLVETLW
jgi:PIN domain nuclease of toxin-antitoxin system